MRILHIWAIGLAAFLSLDSAAFATMTDRIGTDTGTRLQNFAAIGWAQQLQRNAPERVPVPIDAIRLDALPVATGDESWKCLATALYFEARGETLAGQVAVAEVILNRVNYGDFPDTVCQVVEQGSRRLNGCQFSYACDGRPEKIAEQSAYERAGKIARLMLDGTPSALTGGATYFHGRERPPSWARKFAMTAKIGGHTFYREQTRVALE